MHRLFSRWSALACLSTLAALVPGQTAAGSSQEQDAEAAAASSQVESVGDTPDRPATAQQDENGIELQSDGKIRFKFVDAPWPEVIQFFAEQADFSLQPIETEPEGTFKYHDDQAYTVMEALDQLNYALALRGFTLVRNKRLLVLVSTERNIPDDLIETVKPEELDQRGKHEILKCVFDLDGLEDSQISEQIEGLISRSHNEAFHVIPSAKQMIVREKGQTLRTIREFMKLARDKGDRFVVGKHQLEHIDPESVLEAARVLLDLDVNNQSPDGQFKVMVQPLSTELIFRGSAKKVQQFKDVLAQLDVSTNSAITSSTERPRLKQYAISGDLEMAFKVIQTMMAGRDVKFDIDKSTSKALVLGRDDDHKRMEEVLLVLASGGEGFAVIELTHISTAKAMTILDQLYQRDIDSEDKGPVPGPVFFADETNSRLIVKGMPQEVAAVKSYLEQLDVEVVLNTGPRTTKRIIQMDGSAISPDFIEDLFSTTGRENRLQIYMPRGLKPRGSFDQYNTPETTPVDEPPSKSSDEGASKGSGMIRRLGTAAIAMLLAQTPNYSTAVLNLQEPATSESDPLDEPDEPKSVPGADVEVKITDYGIVLTSDDLDALDELESILRSQFEELSASARPGVFYLKWRDPKVAKSILEKLIGLKSSSSSGSDPLSSLIGGGINNMIPGMGDLFSGGGSSAASTAAVFEMESAVVVLADEEMRALIVAASQRDMDIIAPLITDYIDQPGAPHDPKIQGEFYTIPVIHRDPAELKTTLETMLPDLIRTEADQNQAGQNQGPEQQILRQLMQARGGQQAAEEEQKSPKAVLGVDDKGHALLVSGPPFIYEQILMIVQKLDSPELSESSYVIMPLDGRNAEVLSKALKASLGEKIEITGVESASPTSPNANPNQPGANPLGAIQAQQQAEQRNAMMQALQQMNRGGNRGQGQQNRGNRGGGGRGGQGGQGGQGVPGGQIPGIQFQRGG